MTNFGLQGKPASSAKEQMFLTQTVKLNATLMSLHLKDSALTRVSQRKTFCQQAGLENLQSGSSIAIKITTESLCMARQSSKTTDFKDNMAHTL